MPDVIGGTMAVKTHSLKKVGKGMEGAAQVLPHPNLEVVHQLVPVRLIHLRGSGAADRGGPPVVGKVVLHLGLATTHSVLKDVLPGGWQLTAGSRGLAVRCLWHAIDRQCLGQPPHHLHDSHSTRLSTPRAAR